MKLEMPLLSLLASRRMSGYEIKKWLGTEGQFAGLDRHSSQIYRELNRLQTEGWIEFDVQSGGFGPDAKVYRVTDTGMARLDRWVHSPYDPPRRFQEPEFVVRLQAAAMLAPTCAVELVGQELDYRVLQVLANRGRDRSISDRDPRPEVNVADLRLITQRLHEHGMTAIDGWIDWLRGLLPELEARTDQGSDGRVTVKEDQR